MLAKCSTYPSLLKRLLKRHHYHLKILISDVIESLTNDVMVLAGCPDSTVAILFWLIDD
jgi:hypothetical protein